MNPQTMPTSLDSLHLVLIAMSAIISILFSVVVFFIGRDFKSRDERDKSMMSTLTAIQNDLTTHEGKIGALEARVTSNEGDVERVGKNAHDALNIANVLKGRMEGAA
jgi:hypothetical protein